MVATVDQVRASDPAALVQAGAGARSSEAAAERSVSDGQSITSSLSSGWQGDASDAANRQAQLNVVALRQLESMYGRLGTVLTTGGSQLSSMRSEIVGKVDLLTLMGWQVAADGTVSIKRGGVIDNWARISPVVAVTAQLLAMAETAQLKSALAHFTATDSNVADAVRAATRPADVPPPPVPVPVPPPVPPPTPHESTKDTVPGPNPGDPGYRTGQTPTLAGSPADQPPMHVDAGSSASITLQDNPPGYNGPAGPARDAAWQAYLNQSDGTRPGRVDPRTLVLPNPDAVSDPGLKTVGAAAKQQGVSYTWGGGHDPKNPGVSRGFRNDTPDASWTYNDQNRIGFDCSGLARFATAEGRGVDIGSGNTVMQYGAMTGSGAHNVVPDSALKPGDLIYYGTPGDSHHVAVYAGNGLMIQASGSGTPVEVSPIRGEQHRNVHLGP